jgi:acid phosphatase
MGAPLAHATSTVNFLGVAAGDASSTDVVVWTRATDSSNVGSAVTVTLQLSTDNTFSTGVVSQSLTTTTASVGDNTCKANVTGLTPATRYYYRFVAQDDTSNTSLVGTFKTAPSATANYPLHFAFSGDCDGLIRPYALVSQIPAKNLDFFMFDGDTEYETSASIGSAAVTSTGSIPAPSSTGATSSQLFNDFSRKYREQFLPVNSGGQNGLQSFFAGQGNYTTYDNHELGNKQYINGGAPAGGAVGDFSSGAGVDARTSSFDVNTSGTWMNKSGGFQTLQNVFLNYQPIKDRGTITSGTDGNTNGTKQLYSATQWGRHSIIVNTDCRSYRDIRMKTSGNADDTVSRADNANRTYLGKTQLAWLKTTLLNAEQAGTTWKFVNISDPIDQIGPIGGTLSMSNAPTTSDYGTIGSVTSGTVTASSTSSTTLFVTATGASQNGYGLVVGQPITGNGIPSNTTITAVNVNGSITLSNAATVAASTTVTLSGAASTYAPVNSDGGKAWIGGYRAERNELLKFIADNQIKNVVFLATDDHQNRVNEVTYSPSGATAGQSSYVKVPYCISIVCGPLGATGPDLISNHTYALAKKLSDSVYNAQVSAGVEPLGLQGYPGLRNVQRDVNGALTAISSPEAVDFYSPDTFNYNILDVSADGKTLTVTSKGINSTFQNSFLEYDATNNPERTLFSFAIDAVQPLNNIDHIIVVYQENWSFDALYGNFPGANGRANASPASLGQINRIGGGLLSANTTGNFNVATRTSPTLQNPNPQPIDTNNGNIVDTRFPSSLNTLAPYNVASYVSSTATTGDIVHKYWQEMFQVYGADTSGTDHGNNSGFVTWSDNPGLVMSYFDASNMPEGLLAQQYTMCDNFFHSAFGGSFLNHQFFIAAAPPVYASMPTSNNGNIAYLDGTGLFAVNSSGSSAGKVIRDGSITPMAGDVLTGLTINGSAGQTAAVGSSGTPSDVSFQDGTHFDKHYVVNTTFTANMCPTFSAINQALMPSLNNTNPSGAEYTQNIGDLLDNAGVSWKWYSGGWDNALASSKSNPLNNGGTGPNTVSSLFQWHHQAFAYFDKSRPFAADGTATYADGRNPYATAHLKDEGTKAAGTGIYGDIANNTLPAVSFVKFLGPDNEHPGYASVLQGQQHVADLVSAVQANPALWARTLIIITYDEHGGRFDHVTPPARDIWGPGVRVPCIVISPLVNKGVVDHTSRDTSSILSTIEQRFGLPALNARTAAAPTFAGLLTSTPITRSGFTWNRALNKFSQTVTITNNGTLPLVGPIQLVLESLSSNTALSNKTGATVTNYTGSSYITVSSSGLAAGASASVQLLFNVPSTGAVTYTPHVVTGTPAP